MHLKSRYDNNFISDLALLLCCAFCYDKDATLTTLNKYYKSQYIMAILPGSGTKGFPYYVTAFPFLSTLERPPLFIIVLVL